MKYLVPILLLLSVLLNACKPLISIPKTIKVDNSPNSIVVMGNNNDIDQTTVNNYVVINEYSYDIKVTKDNYLSKDFYSILTNIETGLEVLYNFSNADKTKYQKAKKIIKELNNTVSILERERTALKLSKMEGEFIEVKVRELNSLYRDIIKKTNTSAPNKNNITELWSEGNIHKSWLNFFEKNISNSPLTALSILKKEVELEIASTEQCNVDLDTFRYRTPSKLVGLSGLKLTPQLDRLELASHNITNLEDLKYANRITKLYLHCSNLKSLKGIEHLKRLEVLVIRDDNSLTSLDGIEHLIFLEKLFLEGSTVNNINALFDLKEKPNSLYQFSFTRDNLKDSHFLKLKQYFKETDYNNGNYTYTDESRK